MFAILANRTYRHLLLAQIIALVGTGLATVALGLLAYDLAGADAGAVLGTALTIKMVAYIGIASIAGAFANRVPRRAMLVSLDLVRASVALMLPWVSAIWQVYVLIFVLQAASAAFTPTFQATIPDVLPDEEDYTAALSLSRLAYDMESLASPMLAAALLTVISFHWLFAGTAIGFVASALLVVSVTLPVVKAQPAAGGIYDRTTRGARIYLKTPRLRGLLAITLSAAAGSAMIIVNTVVLVRDTLGLDQSHVAWALGAFGGGSMLAAFVLPKIVDRLGERRIMIDAGIVLTILLGAMALGMPWLLGAGRLWPALLGVWLVMGVAYSLTVTPGGRLLRRSAQPDDRPALFAAQFALSHCCWILAYPLAGQLGARLGQPAAFAGLALLAAFGAVSAIRFWPKDDPEALEHSHDDLEPDHEHLRTMHANKARAHSFVIDALHPEWPAR